MSSWTMCPCCGRMIGIRRDGAFRVHVRNGDECPGSSRTIAQILQRTATGARQDKAQPYTPPAHYRRDDGVDCCVHTVPVGLDSCPECRELADGEVPRPEPEA